MEVKGTGRKVIKTGRNPPSTQFATILAPKVSGFKQCRRPFGSSFLSFSEMQISGNLRPFSSIISKTPLCPRLSFSEMKISGNLRSSPLRIKNGHQGYQSKVRSLHLGLKPLIMSIFSFLNIFLILFSLVMALITSPVSS
jgi:hypothetical protein